MKSLKHKTIWLTGASSGIGEAIAYALAKKNTRLILSARRTDELKRVQKRCIELGSEAEILSFDLAGVHILPQIAEKALAIFGRIDILINNGGISQRSEAMETSMEIDRRIMDVNYFSSVALTKALLPHMLAQGEGTIAVMSSFSGKFGWKQRTAYAASKFALHGFYESLRAELASKNIQVLIICPARVNTDISFHAIKSDGSEHGIKDPAQQRGLSATKVANKIVRALEREKKEILIARIEWVAYYLRKFMPGIFYRIAANIDPNKI